MFKERLNPTTTVAVVQTLKPEIMIHKQAIAKMMAYVKNCTDEIGWLGTAIKKKGIYIIKDVYLFDQEVHSTTTEITSEGLGLFGEQLLTQPNGMEIWNELKVWGHSHVNMSVQPSGQDNKQMETFATGGHDWFIRIIANKDKELKVDVYDFNNGIIFIDCHWETLLNTEEYTIQKQIKELQKKLSEYSTSYFEEIENTIKPEILQKVKKKIFYTPNYTNTNYGNRLGYRDYNEYGSVKNFNEKKINEEKGSDVPSAFSLLDMLNVSDLFDIGETCNRINDVEVWLFENGLITKDKLYKLPVKDLLEILDNAKSTYIKTKMDK